MRPSLAALLTLERLGVQQLIVLLKLLPFAPSNPTTGANQHAI